MRTSLFVACVEIGVLGVLGCCVLAVLDQVFTPAQGAAGAKWPISAFAVLSTLTVVGHVILVSNKPDTGTGESADAGKSDDDDPAEPSHHALAQAFLSAVFAVLMVAVAQVVAATDGALDVSVMQRRAASNATAWPNQDTCLPPPDPNDTFVLYRSSHMSDWRAAMTGTSGWAVDKNATLCNATLVEMSPRGGMDASGMGLVVLGTTIGMAFVFTIVGCIAVTATTRPGARMPLFLEPTGLLCSNILIALPLVSGVTDVYAGCQDGAALGFGFFALSLWGCAYGPVIKQFLDSLPVWLAIDIVTHLIPFLATLKPGVPGGVQILSGVLSILGVLPVLIASISKRLAVFRYNRQAVEMAQASSFIPSTLRVPTKGSSGGIAQMFNTVLDHRVKRL